MDDGSWGIQKPFVDPGLMRELEHVFTLLKQRGVQVVIVLNPYHPYVWTCVSAITCDALRTREFRPARYCSPPGAGDCRKL